MGGAAYFTLMNVDQESMKGMRINEENCIVVGGWKYFPRKLNHTILKLSHSKVLNTATYL